MMSLRQALASSSGFTPQRVAVLIVAAFTAVLTPAVVGLVPAAAEEVAGRASALLVVVGTTTLLSAALAWVALRAESTVHARLWLAFGAALAGALACVASYGGVQLLGAPPHAGDFPGAILGSVLLGSVLGGGVLGFLCGTAYGPVVLAARRCRESPSHDGIDRVLVAGGASLLALGAGRALLPDPLPGAALGAAAGVVGVLAALAGAARIAARGSLVVRAREGVEPGVHVVPLSGHEDEAPLLPLVRTTTPPRGVLAATGISAAYRGARGVFKVALAPLADEPFDNPLRGTLREMVGEGGHALLTLAVGITALLVFSPIMVVLVVALG